jgi:hypothetical protein
VAHSLQMRLVPHSAFVTLASLKPPAATQLSAASNGQRNNHGRCACKAKFGRGIRSPPQAMAEASALC